LQQQQIQLQQEGIIMSEPTINNFNNLNMSNNNKISKGLMSFASSFLIQEGGGLTQDGQTNNYKALQCGGSSNMNGTQATTALDFSSPAPILESNNADL
jgi:hypothetical protein